MDRLEYYAPSFPLKPWVCILAKRVALEFYREQGREQCMSPADLADRAAFVHQGLFDALDAADALPRAFRQARLTDEEAAIYTLHYGVGLSVADVQRVDVALAVLLRGRLPGGDFDAARALLRQPIDADGTLLADAWVDTLADHVPKSARDYEEAVGALDLPVPALRPLLLRIETSSPGPRHQPATLQGLLGRERRRLDGLRKKAEKKMERRWPSTRGLHDRKGPR